jgi:hypothetical protein
VKDRDVWRTRRDFHAHGFGRRGMEPANKCKTPLISQACFHAR